MTDGPKEGELFRLNYMRKEVKLSDSARARRRYYGLFLDSTSHDRQVTFAEVIDRRLGIEYPSWTYDLSHDEFWERSETRDFLSAITIWLQINNVHPPALKLAREIIEQEDLHYRIDDQGGVHFLVDEEFHRVAESTLSGLADARFGAARAALEDGLKALSPIKQSGKGLIRGVFEATESTFLVVIGPGAATHLNRQAIDKYLKPILQGRYKGIPEADDKISRMLETFSAWVKDAHPYRHGAPFEEVHEAPLDLAFLSATSGMGFIRFLAGLLQTA